MSETVPVAQVSPAGGTSTSAKEAIPSPHSRCAAPRETIDVAFKNSAYPTPYGDHTVPGDRPGHRVRHLGRDYAPQPLTRSHMNNALVVPYVDGVSLPDHGEGTAASVNPATHYVLNVKNGGKRHFDERRGAESPWAPAKRYAPPPGTQAGVEVYGISACDKPHRRGLGVYNLDTGAGRHPDATSALERRQVKGEADLRGGLGKAMVVKPADHSVFQLGLAHEISSAAASTGRKEAVRSSSPRGSATGASGASQPHTSSPAHVAVTGASPSPSDGPTAAATHDVPAPSRYVNNGFVFSSGYVDEAYAIGGTPYIGSVRPQQDVPDYLVARQVREQWLTTKREQRTAARRNDDVHAVEQLPEW